MAWEYGPMAPGAAAVAMTFFMGCSSLKSRFCVCIIAFQCAARQVLIFLAKREKLCTNKTEGEHYEIQTNRQTNHGPERSSLRSFLRGGRRPHGGARSAEGL